MEADKAARWREHIADWQASGLTRTAYCAQQGVKVSTLDYWRRRLPEASRPAEAVGFVPVQIGPPAAELRLEWRGMTLCLPAAVSADWLAGLLRRLQAG
jgi:hypothetical protein